MAHEPELRDAWERRTNGKSRTRRSHRRGSSRGGKARERKGSRSERRRARRTARAVRALASTVADSVGEVIGAILNPRAPAPSATPRPSPGPPPKAKRTDPDRRRAVAEALADVGRTRSYVSETTDELLKRIPESSRTQKLRRVLTDVRDWAEGRTRTIPVIPKRLPRSWPGRGASVSKVGIVIDLITNLAEGDEPKEAIEDTTRATVFGVMGGVIATFTGPFRIIAGDAYANFGANYDEYLAAAREYERANPDYLERADRAERTGYGFRCDQYAAMGFKPQDTPGCEE
jgi:hypothetical protein